MTVLLNALAASLTGLVLLPVSVFAVQVFAAGRGRLSVNGAAALAPVESTATDNAVLAVLVPAHDEALVIAATLADIRAQLRQQCRDGLGLGQIGNMDRQVARHIGKPCGIGTTLAMTRT